MLTNADEYETDYWWKVVAWINCFPEVNTTFYGHFKTTYDQATVTEHGSLEGSALFTDFNFTVDVESPLDLTWTGEYYFDSSSGAEVWEYNQSMMTDGNFDNWSRTTFSDSTRLLTNNVPVVGLTPTDCWISKVEISALWKKNSTSNPTYLILTPYFSGIVSGDYFSDTLDVAENDTATWTPWYDITSADGAPSSWVWQDVRLMDCYVQSIIDPMTGGNVSCSYVAIRVTYHPNVTFETNASGGWLQVGDRDFLDHNGTAWSGETDIAEIDSCSTTYWWRTGTLDSGGGTNYDYFNFTTGPPEPPVISDVYPANGSTGIGLQIACHIKVSDANNDDLNVTWYNSTDGLIFNPKEIDSNVNSGDTVYWTYVDALSYNTLYYWKVDVDDDTFTTTAIYHFTTGSGGPSGYPGNGNGNDSGNGNGNGVEEPPSIPPVEDPEFPEDEVPPHIPGDPYDDPPEGLYTAPLMYQLISSSVKTDSQVTIVTIDSGIAHRVYGGIDLLPVIPLYHPEYLDGSDNYGHGTFVNYIIQYGIQNFCPNAVHYSLKTFDNQGKCTREAFLQALDQAMALEPDVVTISAGSPSADPTDTWSQKVDELRANGIFVVVSAGNNGPAASTVTSPACARGAYAVGAINPNKSVTNLEDDQVCVWSSRGPIAGIFPKPDVVAPGESILGPWGATGEKVASGTSMAAPFVAFTALQIISANQGTLGIIRTMYGDEEYLNVIEESIKSSCYDNYHGLRNSYGWGIPNVDVACGSVAVSAAFGIANFIITLIMLIGGVGFIVSTKFLI